MPEQLNMEWVDSVKVLIWCFNCFYCLSPSQYWLTSTILCLQHVFDYFTDRTPRSYFEEREASLVWSYRHAGAWVVFRETIFCFACSLSSYWSCHHDIDVEFGRLQARDMLQHLWTGPISNASVEVVQGSRSVEVRAANVTKVIVFLIIDFSQFCFHLQNFRKWFKIYTLIFYLIREQLLTAF